MPVFLSPYTVSAAEGKESEDIKTVIVISSAALAQRLIPEPLYPAGSGLPIGVALLIGHGQRALRRSGKNAGGMHYRHHIKGLAVDSVGTASGLKVGFEEAHHAQGHALVACLNAEPLIVKTDIGSGTVCIAVEEAFVGKLLQGIPLMGVASK